MGSTSLNHVVDVLADVALMFYFVSGKLTLLNKMYLDSGKFGFHGSRIERFVETCTVLQENCFNADFFNFLKLPLHQSRSLFRQTGNVSCLIFTGYL